MAYCSESGHGAGRITLVQMPETSTRCSYWRVITYGHRHLGTPTAWDDKETFPKLTLKSGTETCRLKKDYIPIIQRHAAPGCNTLQKQGRRHAFESLLHSSNDRDELQAVA
jgi:hypothetical protein